MMYLLQPGQTIELPAQLLVVRVQPPAGQPVPRVEALAAGTGGASVHQPSGTPGLLALSVAEPTTIRVRPVAAGPFGAGSVFTLHVQTEGADASSVALQGIDASGLLQRDLVVLEPRGEVVAVRAVAETRDVSLPATADAARMRARAHLGVPRLPESAAVELAVVVDVSASMTPFAAGGELEQALELLLGVSQVVAGPGAPAASCCGRRLRPVLGGAPETWAAAVTRAAAEQRPVVGFRSRAIPRGGERGVTFVLTDDLPADLDSERPDLRLVLLGVGEDGAESAQPGTTPITTLPTRPGSVLTADEVGAAVVAILDHLPPSTMEPHS